VGLLGVGFQERQGPRERVGAAPVRFQNQPDGSRQVYRGRAGPDDAIRGPIRVQSHPHAQSETERTRAADDVGASHGERADRLDNLIDCAEIAQDELTRQETLVDDPYGLLGPGDRRGNGPHGSRLPLLDRSSVVDGLGPLGGPHVGRAGRVPARRASSRCLTTDPCRP
jgi:hypothetical protein